MSSAVQLTSEDPATRHLLPRSHENESDELQSKQNVILLKIASFLSAYLAGVYGIFSCLIMVSLDRIATTGAVTSIGGDAGFDYTTLERSGLDAADPVTAIKTMQTINAIILIPPIGLFFVIPFFGLPLLCVYFLYQQRKKIQLNKTVLACLLTLVGEWGVTMLRNVPLNDILGVVDITRRGTETMSLQETWLDYSNPWQTWNSVRGLCSALAAVLFAA